MEGRGNMDDFELRLLTKEEVYVDKYDSTKTTALKVLQNYGNVCAQSTDLACLAGGIDSYNETMAEYWLQPNLEKKEFYYLNSDGEVKKASSNCRDNSIRLVLRFLDKKVDEYDLHFTSINGGLYWFEFGEYPQYILSAHHIKLINELNTKFCEQKLQLTGKGYCFYYGRDKEASMRYMAEYQYNGAKYIPFIPFTTSSHLSKSLSTGVDVDFEKMYWLKVDPIIWLYDEETGLCVSENALVAGAGFDFVKGGGSMESTEMYQYLNIHLKQDILPSGAMKENKSNVLDSNSSLKKYVYKQYGKKSNVK